jgi:hypothetical protein
MLQEIKQIKHYKDEPFRRWFYSRNLDLTVWYNDDDEIIIFQLSYKIDGEEKALTWRGGRSYRHNKVDTGEDSPARPKKTPLLVADGVFDKSMVIDQFLAESSKLDEYEAKFIVEKLKAYNIA